MNLLRLIKLKNQKFLGQRRGIGLLSPAISVRMFKVIYGENTTAVAQPLSRY